MNHATIIPAADDHSTFDAEADASQDQAATIIPTSPAGTDERDDGDEPPPDRGETIISIISEQD